MTRYFSNYDKKDWKKLIAFIIITTLCFLPTIWILETITQPALIGVDVVLKPFNETDLTKLTPEETWGAFMFVWISLFSPFVPLLAYVIVVPYLIDLILKPLKLNKLKNPNPNKV